MIYGNPRLMMFALIAASDPMLAKQALSNIAHYLFSDDIQIDPETVLDIVAQTLSMGYAAVEVKPLTEEEIVQRFRDQLGSDD